MITTRIAINGLGRIGRAFLKIALERPELEIVAVNEISEAENLAYPAREGKSRTIVSPSLERLRLAKLLFRPPRPGRRMV